MTTTPRTVLHVGPVPGSDVEAQIEALHYLHAVPDGAAALASIDAHLATLARAARHATVAGSVVAGAAAVAAVALVVGEVRR